MTVEEDRVVFRGMEVVGSMEDFSGSKVVSVHIRKARVAMHQRKRGTAFKLKYRIIIL